MWYIYKHNREIIFSRNEPKEKYFTIDKLPPKPNQKYLELKADFQHETVWWAEKELTKEQQKEKRINEILLELSELDQKITRVQEDIIEELNKATGYIPYTTTIEVINHKEDLRDELKQLGE